MSGFYGGDTEQMREHSASCTGGAQRLAELISALSSAVSGVEWVGPDAEGFRSRWHGEVEGRAHAADETLRRLADELGQHAEEQDRASAGDGGGLLDLVGRILPALFPGPLMPLPLPIPGMPLGPGVIDGLGDALDGWFHGNGGTGPQEFYGDPGYGAKGGRFGEDRPVGTQVDEEWGGRFGYGDDDGRLDLHGGAELSAGTNVTTDSYGNVTGTMGLRGSAEAGLDVHNDLPAGLGLDAGMRVDAEAYDEFGGTIGPDGFSAGARVGGAVYGEQSAALTHESGASAGMTQSYWLGAEEHANAYSHVTRNEDGQVNGFTSGFDAGAFAGGTVTQTYEGTSPGGWFSGSASITETAGEGASIAAGRTISTDEISVSVGGKAAEALGLGGATELAVHPNAIVESFTGGYNLDDAIGDARGALDGAMSSVGDAVSSLNPFG